jgi:hypothetical protein
MPKGLKKNFPYYGRAEDILLLEQVNLGRLTPKTFNSFIKEKHGPDADPNDYIIVDIIGLIMNEEKE